MGPCRKLILHLSLRCKQLCHPIIYQTCKILLNSFNICWFYLSPCHTARFHYSKEWSKICIPNFSRQVALKSEWKKNTYNIVYISFGLALLCTIIFERDDWRFSLVSGSALLKLIRSTAGFWVRLLRTSAGKKIS